jgi:hypothetical protein
LVPGEQPELVVLVVEVLRSWEDEVEELVDLAEGREIGRVGAALDILATLVNGGVTGSGVGDGCGLTIGEAGVARDAVVKGGGVDCSSLQKSVGGIVTSGLTSGLPETSGWTVEELDASPLSLVRE